MDNRTPALPEDDFYYVKFKIISLSGSSTDYTVSINNQDYGPYSIGIERQLRIPADGNTYTLFFNSTGTESCGIIAESSQESCSELCVMYLRKFIVGNCDDNGTPDNISDDTYTISYQLKVWNPGIDSLYKLKIGSQSFGPYEYDVLYQLTLPANGQNYTFKFIDQEFNDCTTQKTVSKEHCSDGNIIGSDDDLTSIIGLNPDLRIQPDYKTIFATSTKAMDQSGRFYVYPNPVNETLYISSDIEIKSFRLLDINGRIILPETKIANNSINVSSLVDGIYLISIMYSNLETVVKKFIKL